MDCSPRPVDFFVPVYWPKEIQLFLGFVSLSFQISHFVSFTCLSRSNLTSFLKHSFLSPHSSVHRRRPVLTLDGFHFPAIQPSSSDDSFVSHLLTTEKLYRLIANHLTRFNRGSKKRECPIFRSQNALEEAVNLCQI